MNFLRGLGRDGMIARARDNARRAGAGQVEFRLGEIERLPVADRTVDVSVVKGRKFDSCIDVSGYFHRHVRMLAEAVKATVPHFCFVSTISVYADWRPSPAIDESFDVATTETPDHEVRDGKDYGVQLANVPPAEGDYMTGARIAQYGESTIEHLQQW